MSNDRAQNQTAGDSNRRQFLTRSLWLSTFFVGGQLVRATPSEAKQLKFTPQVLSAAQISALESIAEALVPGAEAAGIGAYIDDQLNKGDESLLMIKYLGVPLVDQPGFYTSALDAITRALENAVGTTEHKIDELITAMASDAVRDWRAPPASFVLFALRSDCLDVTYGTPSGFADLGIPYNAHIEPAQLW